MRHLSFLQGYGREKDVSGSSTGVTLLVFFLCVSTYQVRFYQALKVSQEEIQVAMKDAIVKENAYTEVGLVCFQRFLLAVLPVFYFICF